MRKQDVVQGDASRPSGKGVAEAGSRPDGAVRIGCAGWSLSSRVADRFPGEGSHLERYARVFNSVEIDTSFYRPHREATYARWREAVPDDFRFAVKLPRTITHDQRLAGIETLLDDYLQGVHALQHKLGCLLVQLPPSLAFAEDVVSAFFACMRQATDVALACEPRHRTWFTDAAAKVMGSYGVTFVQADPNPVGIAPPVAGTEMTYVRLHGSPVLYRSAYPDEVLDAQADAVRQSVQQGQTAWVVFDNTAQGEAVPNALDLQQRLGHVRAS